MKKILFFLMMPFLMAAGPNPGFMHTWVGISVKEAPYNAYGDGVHDDTAAIQAAINAAVTTNGNQVIFPKGKYLFSSTLTNPSQASCLKLIGLGKGYSLFNGNSGDPSDPQGAELVYTGTSGDGVSFNLSTSGQRLYVTFENIDFIGNSSMTSGNGIHFYCHNNASGILPTFRDVNVLNFVNGAGCFFDGNVFEGKLDNIRFNQNLIGLLVSSPGPSSGTPSETSVYRGTFQSNSYGVSLSGGGQWQFYSCLFGSNSTMGILSYGTQTSMYSPAFESNGPSNGCEALFEQTFYCHLYDVLITPVISSTGCGVSFNNMTFSRIEGFNSSDGSVGVGYNDISLNGGSSRNIFTDIPTTNTVNLGVGGGNMVWAASLLQTGLPHNQQAITITTSAASVTLNTTLYDDFYIIMNSGASGPTITATSGNYQAGQIIALDFFNNSGGSVGTINFNPTLLNGSFTSPTNGNHASVMFHNTPAGWLEVGR